MQALKATTARHFSRSAEPRQSAPPTAAQQTSSPSPLLAPVPAFNRQLAFRPYTADAKSNGQRKCVIPGAGRRHYAFFFGNSDPDITVFKLQVGMFGKVNLFKKQLDQLADLADTDDQDDLFELMQEVLMLISRNLEYCAYGSAAISLCDDMDEAERKYNSTSLKERQKVRQETKSNIRGRFRQSELAIRDGDDVGLDQWMVITLLACVEQTVKLPRIGSLADLQRAINRLRELSADDLIAIELMWSPQAQNDDYSREEMLADHPTLATL